MFRTDPILEANCHHAARGEVMRVWNELRHHGHIPVTAMEEKDRRSRSIGRSIRKKHMSNEIEAIMVHINVGSRGFEELFIP